MAIVIDNDLTAGLSGAFGKKMIFKQLRGKTIVAHRAKSTYKGSPLQQDNRLRFKKATAYAKAMMQDAEKKAYYWEKAKELKLPNAYTAAITEYMRKPAITAVDVSQEGSMILVRVEAVKKSFPVRAIKIRAVGTGEVTIEEGLVTGTFAASYGFNLSWDALHHIEVEAEDRIGNRSVKKILLNELLTGS